MVKHSETIAQCTQSTTVLTKETKKATYTSRIVNRTIYAINTDRNTMQGAAT